MPDPVSILDVIKRGGYEASLITTFNATLPFYEEVLLRCGCRVSSQRGADGPLAVLCIVVQRGDTPGWPVTRIPCCRSVHRAHSTPNCAFSSARRRRPS